MRASRRCTASWLLVPVLVVGDGDERRRAVPRRSASLSQVVEWNVHEGRSHLVVRSVPINGAPVGDRARYQARRSASSCAGRPCASSCRAAKRRAAAFTVSVANRSSKSRRSPTSSSATSRRRTWRSYVAGEIELHRRRGRAPGGRTSSASFDIEFDLPAHKVRLFRPRGLRRACRSRTGPKETPGQVDARSAPPRRGSARSSFTVEINDMRSPGDPRLGCARVDPLAGPCGGSRASCPAARACARRARSVGIGRSRRPRGSARSTTSRSATKASPMCALRFADLYAGNSRDEHGQPYPARRRAHATDAPRRRLPARTPHVRRQQPAADVLHLHRRAGLSVD